MPLRTTLSSFNTTSPGLQLRFGYSVSTLLPTIRSTISSRVKSFVGRVSMTLPSRTTVAVSHISKISSILCEIYTMVVPVSFSVCMISNRCRVSPVVREDVGSSITMTRGFLYRTLAISTICF